MAKETQYKIMKKKKTHNTFDENDRYKRRRKLAWWLLQEPSVWKYPFYHGRKPKSKE